MMVNMSELNNMRTSDFSFLTENEAFFYVDHNNCLCSTISGKVIAANREQLDILIRYFQKIRGKVQPAPYWLSERQYG